MRFKICTAGRRSGKTELAKRKLVLSLWDCLIHQRDWQDPRFFAAAPTRDQARRIFWDDLKRLTPTAWLDGRARESDLMLRTRWGAELHVLGLDAPARIEGTPWDGGVIDELANCKPGIWDAHIRPALSDRKGWVWQIGVPDFDAPGQVEYKKRHDEARSGIDPEWSAYNWASADILDPQEVASAKRRMDPLLFDQEYGGKFVLAGGLAFPTFDYATHVGNDTARALTQYDPNLSLCWSLDFNVDPMCSGIIQHHKGVIRVIKEFVLPDTDTNVMCEAFIEWVEENKIDARNVRVYGDPTGKARDSTSGKSDWSIVRQRLKNFEPIIKVPSAPWPIKDTLNSLRAKVKNAEGNVGLYVNADCTVLIDDFGKLLWPSDLSDGHCVAWLRYFTMREYPVNSGHQTTSSAVLG